jgi:hypothetical protein
MSIAAPANDLAHGQGLAAQMHARGSSRERHVEPVVHQYTRRFPRCEHRSANQGQMLSCRQILLAHLYPIDSCGNRDFDLRAYSIDHRTCHEHCSVGDVTEARHFQLFIAR